MADEKVDAKKEDASQHVDTGTPSEPVLDNSSEDLVSTIDFAETAKVEGADADPESGCLYVYFKTPEIGHKFITRLNAYLEKRYQDEPEVRETHEALVQAYERQQKERAS